MNRIDRLTAIVLLLQGGKRTVGELARRPKGELVMPSLWQNA
ncbi:hypothetical protein [Ktedonosporobacter rubrisoli]|nr:hypothetical protein [Ktedonosporobacter rubrisoli]